MQIARRKPARNVTIRLPYDERRLLAGWARADGTTRTVIVREMIERERRRRESIDAHDLNARAGIKPERPE